MFLEKVKGHVPSWKGHSLLVLLMNQNGIFKKKGALHFIKPSKKNFKNYFKSISTHLETFLKSEKGDFKNIEYLKTQIRFMD